MSQPPNRTTEEAIVGLHLLVLCGSIALFGWVQVASVHPLGGAFIVIGLFWFTVITAVAASLVVLAMNGYRIRRNTVTDRWTIFFALLILLSYGSALYLAFVTNHLQLSMVVGGIGFLASLGLIAAVFEDRVRRQLVRQPG